MSAQLLNGQYANFFKILYTTETDGKRPAVKQAQSRVSRLFRFGISLETMTECPWDSYAKK